MTQHAVCRDAESCSFVTHSSAGIDPAHASKMDKYFDAAYDPRLDVSVEDLTSASGQIAPSRAFDEWDAMLRVVRERKEDDRERKRREKDERHRERERIREERRERRTKKRRRREGRSGSASSFSSSGASVGPRAAKENDKDDLLSVEGYAKKGGVRAWDQGKIVWD